MAKSGEHNSRSLLLNALFEGYPCAYPIKEEKRDQKLPRVWATSPTGMHSLSG
jgi:hypothetical protein